MAKEAATGKIQDLGIGQNKSRITPKCTKITTNAKNTVEECIKRHALLRQMIRLTFKAVLGVALSKIPCQNHVFRGGSADGVSSVL